MKTLHNIRGVGGTCKEALSLRRGPLTTATGKLRSSLPWLLHDQIRCGEPGPSIDVRQIRYKGCRGVTEAIETLGNDMNQVVA